MLTRGGATNKVGLQIMCEQSEQEKFTRCRCRNVALAWFEMRSWN